MTMDMATIAILAETGEAAAERSDWEAAVEAWQEVIRLSPHYPKCFNKAAVCLRKLRRFDESDAVIAQAIAVLGAQPDHYIILGDTAMDRRRWRMALSHWEKLRALAPKVPKGYLRAAHAHLALKDPVKADAVCVAGLAEMPRDKRLLMMHIEVAISTGNLREVVARANKAARLHPLDTEIARLRDEFTAAGPQGSDPAALNQGTNASRPSVRALEAHLDSLQGRGVSLKLQERIEAARKAWQTGLPLARHGGIMRHFALAKQDDRLARVLAGETDRNRGRAPGAPIRVVFFFPHVTQTDHLSPLFERMQADPRFEPIILCCRGGGTSQADSFEVFSQKYPASEGWRVVDGGSHVDQNISPYELGADQVFFHTPYSLNADRPFYMRADFVARHAKVAHVTYGYPLLTLDTPNYHVYAGDHVRNCDMFFAESPACLEAYGRHIDPEKVIVTGYTKADEFRRHMEPVPFDVLAARPGPLDVMWTPHWHVPGDPRSDTITSNFLPYRAAMLRIAARDDIQLHVRPHPLLRLKLNSLNIMKFDEYDAVLEQFRQAGAKVYPAEEGVSYVPALMQTAVLVSDFSSLVAEYTITNRPILFCRTEDVWTNGRWIGAFGKTLIENCCYLVDDAAGLEARLDELLKTRRHPLAERMADFVAQNDLFPAGSSVDRICDLLDQSFNQS